MLIHWCKTGSKLGHFTKIANLFKQNGRGQGVVKIQDEQFLPKLLRNLGYDL